MKLIDWFKKTGEPGAIVEVTEVDFVRGDVSIRAPRWNVELVLAWYDFWIGLYIDREKRIVYFLPLPCIGIRVFWG